MSKLHKRAELFANVAIIIVASLLCVVLVKNYLYPGGPQAGVNRGPREAGIPVGTKIDIPNINWERNGRTLVLALSTTCHFCSDSAPLYRQIAKRKSGGSSILVVAVVPQSTNEGQKYLNGLGVEVDQLEQVPLNAIGVSGTPTLMIVGGDGKVVKSWVGKLTADEENEMLSQL